MGTKEDIKNESKKKNIKNERVRRETSRIKTELENAKEQWRLTEGSHS